MPSWLQPILRRRYWPAWLTFALGLAATTGLTWGLYRQAMLLDGQRFRLETEILAQLLESTMERYEERLTRLADRCAELDDVPDPVWAFLSGEVTGFRWQLPNVVHAVYCPVVPVAGFEAHAIRGRAVKGEPYVFDPAAGPDRKLALPVWQSWSSPGFTRIPAGTDMAEATTWHPALGTALGRVPGWISPAPVQVPRTDGGFENGFWFALPIFKPDQPGPSPWQRRSESDEERGKRHRSFYAAAATGLLAVFISADRLVDEAFNDPQIPHRAHVRLYANRTPDRQSLLNPVSAAPLRPRHQAVIVQPWYGRRWAMEVTSTPQFEADSPRHRAWVVLGGGSGMTLLATALLGVALRARDRQALLAEQIQDARDALATTQKERERLNHDLHDNTVQSLYAVQLGLGHTAQKLTTDPATAQSELASARAELEAVTAEIRRFITAESGSESPVDLPSVLRATVERVRAGSSARIELQCESATAERLTGVQAVQLANIAREALSNSLRHARAQRVDIALRSEASAVCLEVADDGIGFSANSGAGSGVGLTSMRTRTREVGGSLELETAPGRGTRVRVRLPAAPAEAPRGMAAISDSDNP